MKRRLRRTISTEPSLRRLLARKAQALHDAALDHDGQVARRDLVELERLARLARIYDETRDTQQSSRWPAAIALLATLAVASVLLFARVRETEIELQVTASEAGFTLRAPQRLLQLSVLSSLGASGLREVRMPSSVAAHVDSGPESAVRLSVVDAPAPTPPTEGPARPPKINTTPGTITLAALVPPAGADVLVGGGDGGEYRLSLRKAPIPIEVFVHGAIRVGRTTAPPETFNHAIPRSLTLLPAEDAIDLELGYSSEPGPVFSTALSVQNLSLSRTSEVTEGERTIVRRESTVLVGAMYFESLDGREVRLRPAEGLRFASADGEIRSLRLAGGNVELTFRGQVRGMTIGTETSRRSLMPTYLEWLRANHGLSLLWGSVVSVFGLAMIVLRWLKGTV